ncbi:MAG: hypothetical protein KDB14_08330 [Planctomycetales bacterium]|nr:hypothetical protein [Planctomycetales bacterium]
MRHTSIEHLLCALALVITLGGDAVLAQMGGPGMGGGGASPPPLPQGPSFRERVWQEGGPSFSPTDGELVAEVRVVGNESTSTNQVLSMLKTRPDRVFDPDTVEADVRRLASRGIFRDVKILTERLPTGVVVTFQVAERPTMRYVRFVGNHKLSDKTLRKEVGIKPGDPMNLYAVEDARRRLESLYHRRGYPQALVEILEGAKPDDKGVVLAMSEGDIERVLSVDFVGNTIVSDARLKTQIQTKPGVAWYFFRGKVDKDKIDQDVEKLSRYYKALGYFQARIGRELNYTSSGQWLKLTFVIDEGPRYKVRDIRVNGVTRFDPREVVQQMELKEGEPFFLAKMNKDLNQLRDLYGANGYAYVDVQAEPRFLEEPGALDLVYNVEEGQQFRIGEINVNIEGDNPHTRRMVVMNRLGIRPGEIIDIRKIRAGERRLGASQLFETNPAMGEPPSITLGTPNYGSGAANIASGASAVRGQSPQ